MDDRPDSLREVFDQFREHDRQRTAMLLERQAQHEKAGREPAAAGPRTEPSAASE